jgi:hypothetical protein
VQRRRKTISPGAILVWIDNQRRIDVDCEAIATALNLKISPGETVYVWAVPSSQKQLQLLPAESELSKLRNRLQRESTRHVAWDAGGHADVATYRQMEGFFKVPCRLRKSGKTLRITLPSDVMDLGYFRLEDPFVLYCVGELVELWPCDRWREASSVQDLSDLVRRARRALTK